MRFSAFVAVAAIAVPALAQDPHAGMDMGLTPVSSTLAVAPASAATPKKGPATYAPISQINDGQIQAPTGTPAPPAPPAPVSPTPAPPAPPATTAAPPIPSDSTSTNTRTKTGTKTLSLSSAPAPPPPAPTVSRPPPPAVQTGAAAIMNAASGLSFAAFVAFVLA